MNGKNAFIGTTNLDEKGKIEGGLWASFFCLVVTGFGV